VALSTRDARTSRRSDASRRSPGTAVAVREVAVAAERSRRGAPTLRVTWVKSTIGHKAAARGTIRALGLHRLHQTVEVEDTPVTRGMLRRVAFLVEVAEPASRSSTGDGEGAGTKEESAK
jgi:large subunit ribosomal protein L30